MYEKTEIEFLPTHKLILLTNHKPIIPAEEYAAWERVVLIPFTLSYKDNPKEFYERKRDPYLKDKLLKESSGILSWLVKGFLLWQKEGLNPPDQVKVATKEYQRNEDVIGQFIDESCVVRSDGQAQARPLYDWYKKWCEHNSYSPLGSRKFGERMKERFERTEISGKRYYKGLELGTLIT